MSVLKIERQGGRSGAVKRQGRRASASGKCKELVESNVRCRVPKRMSNP